MTDTSTELHGRRAVSVELFPRNVAPPDRIDAGTDFSIRGRVSCPEGCDLTGDIVSVRGPDDAELAAIALRPVEVLDESADDDTYVTEEITLAAPATPGDHVYRAVVAAERNDEVAHEESAAQFTVAVKTHTPFVHVWGLPATLGAGKPMTFKVGIKCSAGCDLSGRKVVIVDHEGRQASAEARLADVWPGTTALYYTEIQAEAPGEPGDFLWRIQSPASRAKPPHAAGESSFRVRVVAAPDREIVVEAIDSERGVPVKGLHVLLHPYRTRTDENGMARVRVTMGRYKLVVSGFKYAPFEHFVDASSDVRIKAELTAMPDPEPYPLR